MIEYIIEFKTQILIICLLVLLSLIALFVTLLAHRLVTSEAHSRKLYNKNKNLKIRHK